MNTLCSTAHGAMLSPKKWWHWEIAKNQCHRNPYKGRSDLLTFPSVMVSCKKVSCYDTQYADQHEPICIYHNRPPFLALRGENRPRHWLYGTLAIISVVSKFPTPNSLVLHVCVCKYDYTPAFGNWQAGRGKWAISPRIKSQYGEKPVISRVHRLIHKWFIP